MSNNATFWLSGRCCIRASANFLWKARHIRFRVLVNGTSMLHRGSIKCPSGFMISSRSQPGFWNESVFSGVQNFWLFALKSSSQSRLRASPICFRIKMQKYFTLFALFWTAKVAHSMSSKKGLCVSPNNFLCQDMHLFPNISW